VEESELPVVTGLPAEPAVLGQPIIEDQLLFTTLNDFPDNLPEGFLASKPMSRH